MIFDFVTPTKPQCLAYKLYLKCYKGYKRVTQKPLSVSLIYSTVTLLTHNIYNIFTRYFSSPTWMNYSLIYTRHIFKKRVTNTFNHLYKIIMLSIYGCGFFVTPVTLLHKNQRV